MDRKRTADRVAAERAARQRRAVADEAERAAQAVRSDVRKLERQIDALVPRALKHLEESDFPNIEEVDVQTRRRGFGGLFSGDRRERVGAYVVSSYPIAESANGPRRSGRVRVLSDGRLYVGGGAVYSVHEFTEEVLRAEVGPRISREPFSISGLQQLAKGLSRLASD